MSTPAPPEHPVAFCIKNPAADTAAFSTTLPLTSTIGQVKQRLHQEYPGNPSPSQVTLIYSGKVLKDESAQLKTFIKQEYDPESPYILHIVIKSVSNGSTPSMRPSTSEASFPPIPPQPPSVSTVQEPPASSSANQTTSAMPHVSAHHTAAGANAPVRPTEGPCLTNSAPAHGTGSEAGPSTSAQQPQFAAAADGATSFAGPQGGHWHHGSYAAGYGMPPMPVLQDHAMQLPMPMPAPGLAAAQTMYSAAYSAYQYATQAAATGASQAPQQMQLASMPYIMMTHPQIALVVPLTPMWPGQQQPHETGQPHAAAHAPFGFMGMPPYAPLPLGYMPLLQPPWGPLQPPPQGPVRAAPAPGIGQWINQAFARDRAQAMPAAAAAAGALGRGQQRPVVRVRLLRVNLRMLLQMVIMFFIIYQHCPLPRLLVLSGMALLLYLTTLPMFRRMMHRMVGPLRPIPPPVAVPPQQDQAAPQEPVEQPAEAATEGNAEQQAAPAPERAAAADGAPAAAPADANALPAAQRPRPGLAAEIRALIVGFFTSLLPGWNYNPDDAAAFAAAQELVAREERAAQEGGAAAGAHAHQD